ncbi:carbohydrate ABC transporter permease [Pygmaiobacter massiliensis]|uniref:carbohydrate ABC transporter permease n=1 Tax=Pygmaiobacter massiliensis TaxID=1917873 RepID=UPI000C7D1F22|nr:carbohydrate ABC transporter permease [Pygmaiobacter massiliensis]
MKINKKSPYFMVCVVLLIVLAILFMFPLYWIITGSVKEKSDILLKAGEAIQWWPRAATSVNYEKLFNMQVTWELFGSSFRLPAAIKWLYNSVFISVMAMLLTCVTASLAGYVLAKKNFYGKAIIFGLFVCAMALPKQVILIPLVTLAKTLGLSESAWSVIFPVVGWPFGVFLMKQFSETIPTSLLEAARIDGAGELRTFWDVVVPIIKPGIGALAIFTFINAWNEYPLQLVMLHKTEVKTIALGIAGLQAEMSTDYGLIMAGAALGAIPIIVVFLVFQKYFTQGITMGAVKG